MEGVVDQPLSIFRQAVEIDVSLRDHVQQGKISSGVRQPSISQFLSGRGHGRGHLSDDMLARLLSCKGYRLEVIRRPVKPDLGRSPERSWRLHPRLAMHLTPGCLSQWRPRMLGNLERLRESVRGEPHLGNLDRWERLIAEGDLTSLHRVMKGLDTDSVQMREVSPMGGLLSRQERAEALAGMAA